MVRIHLLGDSLVKSYGNDIDNFIGGWGDHLACFFKEGTVEVFNYANGGRSSRSFLNEGRFTDNGLFTKEEFPYGLGPAYGRIEEGDYCLLEFCHNDDDSKGKATYIDRMTPLGKPDEKGIYPTIVPREDMMTGTDSFPEEYPQVLKDDGMSDEEIEENIRKYKEILSGYKDRYYSYNCGATFKGYYKFYIDKIREKGAKPVIVTPLARQFFETESFKDQQGSDEEGSPVGKVLNSLKPTVQTGRVRKLASIPGHHGGSDEFGEFTYVRAIRQIAEEEGVPVIDLFSFTKAFIEMLGEQDASYLQSIVGYDGMTIGEVLCQRPAKWVEDYDEYREKGNFKKVDDTHTNRYGSFIYAGEIARGLMKYSEELSSLAYTEGTVKADAEGSRKEDFEVLRPAKSALTGQEEEALSDLRIEAQIAASKTVAIPGRLRKRMGDIRAFLNGSS